MWRSTRGWTPPTSSPKPRYTSLVYVTVCGHDNCRLILSQEHLRAWLADSQGRDQYVTYRGDEVAVNWHGKPSQCEVAHTRIVRRTFQSSDRSPHSHVELDEPICLVVAPRHIPCHLTPSRCLPMGRHFVGNETAVRPSTGQTHRLLSER